MVQSMGLERVRHDLTTEQLAVFNQRLASKKWSKENLDQRVLNLLSQSPGKLFKNKAFRAPTARGQLVYKAS